MGTLPHNEIEIERAEFMHGEDVARKIAKDQNDRNGEDFQEGGEIVIMKPIEVAGTYDISAEYEISFYAEKRDPSEE